MGDTKRYRWIPFKEPQPMNTYMKLHRSKNPLEKALELGIVDLKELEKRHKQFERTLKKIGLYTLCLSIAFTNVNLWLTIPVKILTNV